MQSIPTALKRRNCVLRWSGEGSYGKDGGGDVMMVNFTQSVGPGPAPVSREQHSFFM